MDDESAIDLPPWMKLMRFLVFALLCVSIIAMVAVGYAAVRLIGQATAPETEWTNSLPIPDGADPVSLTRLPSGESIVIYDQAGQYVAEIFDASGQSNGKAQFSEAASQ